MADVPSLNGNDRLLARNALHALAYYAGRRRNTRQILFADSKKKRRGRATGNVENHTTMQLSTVGALAAFTAGVISFLSPYVLPLVPGEVHHHSSRGPSLAPSSAAT